MASLTSLADELLLNVVSALDQQPLWSLSLVNKRIGSIAQEALYHRVFIQDQGIVEIIEDNDNPGCFDYISAQLNPIKETIEGLEFDFPYYENTDFLDFIEPFGTYPSYIRPDSFSKLRTLILPQSALFVAQEGSTNALILPLSSILPKSLENLGIIYPTRALGRYSKWFGEARHHLSLLSVMDLYCRNGRGDSYFTILFDDHPGWDEYEKLGIAINVCDQREDVTA